MVKTHGTHPGGKFRREGPNTLSESELLAILIGSGNKRASAMTIAERLIDRYGTVDKIAGTTLRELMEIKGIGPQKATQIAAVFEITKRIIRHLDRE